MIVRKIITVLILIWTTTYLKGQNADDTQNVNTILFEITHQNSDKTSYLFGTHHAFGK
ncbi:hypothetical protein [Pareuzebyella sediminis]|uniref:hypothetical protein n=1 Tax=Pareuzebyella sediminis TaxID=2607998 RepID=UPI0018E15D91|nr:hypothetical protein [Pareuzebyella sediminis]